ncbi:hypothetical protein FJM67_16570 [Maribrevibacterium harenarium]|uniref:Double-GTPase 1 domain-containing protein n=1 Tax=Maribrevibacterium harenarium TaxID=2589817 RepID=A0A501W751_9GAMM|nr:hypothetical protein [Maribrevibacterium harenarium]TPE45118.1 hypothetical protein FJM67_16570 [Maribrevibacterium harenarium]
MTVERSILLIGESNVGKTHYGAQFLKRLMVRECSLQMSGAPTNVEAFTNALACLTEGKATAHTPSEAYLESVWPVTSYEGGKAELVWPDYGGEQVSSLVAQRQIPVKWKERVVGATDWVLMLRLQSIRIEEDQLSRPFHTLFECKKENDQVKASDQHADGEQSDAFEISDQARAIELLQILLYFSKANLDQPLKQPRLTILLSCWDELEATELPEQLLASRLPMLWSFLSSNWKSPEIYGLSALGRPLSIDSPDEEYEIQGPEEFGYVILPDGSQNKDITLPIQRLMAKET